MNVRIKRAADVFWKREEDNKLFVLKPDDCRPPKVFLLNDPALTFWRRLSGKGGALLGDLLGGNQNGAMGAVFRFMLCNELIECTPRVDAEPLFDAASIGLYEDPWEYQFNKPILGSPWFVLWEITDRCPLKEKCLFCYRPDDDDGVEPNAHEWHRIVGELVSNKVPWVTILGGEPLAHENLFDIIGELRRQKIYVKVITNGVLVNDENALQFGESGVNQVAVSLDGLDRKLHDLSRGAGAFKATLAGIERLQRHVPLVSLSLTVSNQTFEQLDRLPDFCLRMGIPEVYLSPVRATSHTVFPAGLGSMTSEQQRQLPEKVATCCRPGLDVISIRECSCGRSSCVIHADGSFSACPFAQSAYGNVYEEGLGSLWSRANVVAEEIGRIVPGPFCFRRHEEEALESLVNTRPDVVTAVASEY